MSVRFEGGQEQQLGPLHDALAHNLSWRATPKHGSVLVTSRELREISGWTGLGELDNWSQELDRAIRICEEHDVQKAEGSAEEGVDVFVGLSTASFSLVQLQRISALFIACERMFFAALGSCLDTYTSYSRLPPEESYGDARVVFSPS